MNDHTHLLCQRYLDILYQQAASSYTPSNIAETRGEILFESISKLIPLMKLTEKDSFIDLGSADGKIVSQIFLTTPVKTAVGIEIVSELHHEAIKISEHIKRELPDFYQNNRELIFIHGDFLKMALDNMTVALINATCFPPLLVDQLGEKIEKTLSIRSVFSLRPINTLQRLVCKKIIPLECSWDSVMCYHYTA